MQYDGMTPQAAPGGAQQGAEDMRARLQAFANSLVSKRKEAVEYRQGSGIETIWAEDEDAYNGIDDANRGTSDATKPATSSGRVLTGESPVKAGGATQSRIFLNITQPYVDMASARLSDMLLPTDDKPFGMVPTPEPDLLQAKQTRPDQEIVDPNTGARTNVAQAVDAMVAEAKKSAEKAENRIWNWLVESNWHAEVRQVIEDAAKIGTGVIKGPFPKVFKRRRVTSKQGQQTIIEVVQETVPRSKSISAWNLFPSPSCGDDIHNGEYIWERDHISGKTLNELKEVIDPATGEPVYIHEAIDAVLKEGPSKKFAMGALSGGNVTSNKADREQFEVWYFNGLATAEDLRAGGCSCDDDSLMIPVEVTMVNDQVIKVAQAVLDSGEFPYDVFRWQKVRGDWTGRGVGRQIRAPQRMVNGAVRNMMDNAGLAAGGQFVFSRKGISPQDGVWEIRPRKVWWVDEDETRTIDQLMKFIEVPMVQRELQAIIDFGLNMAERVTSMPLLMMGMQGDSTKTLGGMQMLNNNGSVVLRRHAKIFDDDIIERHIPRYYEWILLYEDDAEAKANLTVDARGSSALFERDAQNQAMLQMGPMVKDPSFRINPSKWFAEYMKGQRLDPHRFQYTDDEWKQIQQQQAQNPPPQDPRIQVAGMRQETDKAKLDQEAQQRELDRQHESDMQERALQIEMLKMANARNISLDDVKAGLAKVAMQLRTQKELSFGQHVANQVATAPTEPAGRAPDGQAFQQ